MYKQIGIGGIRSYEDNWAGYPKRHEEYFADPDKFRLEPFKIYGNLYNVGDKMACPYLIDTGEGLILIDTGYGHDTRSLLDNIRTLGFRVEDVKIIIHSHGHYDHFGNTELIRKMSGAKVYMSRVDTELLQEMPERALIHLGCVKDMQIPWPDHVLDDGDHVVLGNTDILCVLSAGHTFGTMSFFFDVTEKGVTKRVGYWGGVGFFTMYKQFCEKYQLPATKAQAMQQTIQKLRQHHVDITLGNHPGQNATLDKRRFMLENPGTNPFTDDRCWNILLDKMQENCDEFLHLDY